MPDSYFLRPSEEERILNAADRTRARAASFQSTLDPARVAFAADMAGRYPNLSAELAEVFGQSDMDAEAAEEAASNDRGTWFDIGRSAIGDAVGTVADAVGEGITDGFSGAYEQGLKPFVRGVTTVGDSLSQEFQRPIVAGLAALQGESGFREAYNDYGDSAGLNLLQGDLGEGSGNTLGTGFFAGGRAQAESDRERTLTIDGGRANLGRAFAGATIGHWVDPSNAAYGVLAGVTQLAADVGLDPLTWMTMGTYAPAKGAYSAIRHAGTFTDTLRAAGAAQNTARRGSVVFDVDRVRDAFANKDLLDRLSKADTFDVLRSFRKSGHNHVDGETITAIGRAKTEQEVANVLGEAIGRHEIGNKFYGPGRFEVRNHLPAPIRVRLDNGSKYTTVNATGTISAGSADSLIEAADKLDSLMRQGRVSAAERRKVVNMVADIDVGDGSALKNMRLRAYEAIEKNLRGGVSEETRAVSNINASISRQLEEMRHYADDSLGNPIRQPLSDTKSVTDFAGETIEAVVPQPQVLAEFEKAAEFGLLDPQDIRRATVKSDLMHSVFNSKGWDVTTAAIDTVTSKVFKPFALLRIAYIVRIGLEEQGRLAAAGYDSIFNHPFRVINSSILDPKAVKALDGEDLRTVAQAYDAISKKGADKATENWWSTDFTKKMVSLNPDGNLEREAYRGWRTELGQMSSDESLRKMTEFRGNIEQFREWATEDGRAYFKRVAKANPKKAYLYEDPGGDMFTEWAEGVRERVEAKTGGWDEDIIERVLNDKIPPPGMAKFRDEDRSLYRLLSGKAGQDIRPGYVKVPLAKDPGRMTARYDTIVNGLYEKITQLPTARLARFPVMRQAMVKRGAEIMDLVDGDEARAVMVAAYRKNMRLTSVEARQLEEAASAAAGKRGGPIADVDDFQEVVATKAAHDVKDLLYDTTKSSSAQSAFGAAAPFLDAWVEVNRTWARLLKDNPGFFFRATAGYQSLGESGAFYTDDNGAEVFRYPGGGFLAAFVDEMNRRGGGIQDTPMSLINATSRTVTGDTPDFSVGLEGRVNALNMLTTGVGPGFGPVVQMAAGALLDEDSFALREIFAPFGTPGVESAEDLASLGGLVETFIPAWAEKIRNAVTEGGVDERQYASEFSDSVDALVASGYDPKDIDKLEADARRYTEMKILFRGIVQFTGPTAPSTQDSVKAKVDMKNDPDGKWFTLTALRQDYREMLDVFGPQIAGEKFFDMYGLEPFYLAQGASSGGGRKLPADTEGGRWLEQNRDIVDDHEYVAGYFAPVDEGASLNFDVFNKQFLSGMRESISPEDQIALANQQRARATLRALSSRFESLPPAQRDELTYTARVKLDQQYPGLLTGNILNKRTQDQKIADLVRAADDPRLDDSDLSNPLRMYLGQRENVLAEVKAQSGPAATLGRQDAARAREQLRLVGQRLALSSSSFRAVWSELLIRELEV